MVDIDGGFRAIFVRNKTGEPEHVEVEDDFGFAGIDPTDEQIAATVAEELGIPKTAAELARAAVIATNTRIYHDGLVADGENAVAGFANGLFGRRYTDEVEAGKQVRLGADIKQWQNVLRTTETVMIQEQGE